jgi:hypothetical protein
MIKTLTGVRLCVCPRHLNQFKFHVGIQINEANYVTNTLSRQQSAETPCRKSAECAPLYKPEV